MGAHGSYKTEELRDHFERGIPMPIERGMMFKDRLVRAILRPVGPKTNTRRLVTLPPALRKMGGDLSAAWPDLLMGVTPGLHVPCKPEQSVQRLRNPWGFIPPQPMASEGQPVTLWVREAWDYFGGNEYIYQQDPNCVIYRADENIRDVQRKWRPSMLMPRWASRILLRVKDIRAERLQDITEEDAIAEGIQRDGDWFEGKVHVDRQHPRHGEPGLFHSARDAFASLWDSINKKKPGAAWADSPWVWRIAFERIKPG